MVDDTLHPNPDLGFERLLADYGAAYRFPPTPDIASAVEARLEDRQGSRHRDLRASAVVGSLHDTLDHRPSRPMPLAVAGNSPRASRFRQFAGFAAGVLAFTVLALLLGLMFRGFADQTEDGERGLVLPDASAAPDNLLIAISTVYDEPEETWETKTGRVTAFDPQSGTELFAIDAGSSVEATIAPDGTRLYIHSWSPTGDRDELVAIDTSSGNEVWSTSGKNAVHSEGGVLPSALAVSPDGSRVYVFEPDWNRPPENRGVVPQHVEAFDARDGDKLADYDAPYYCPARLFPSPDGRTLYVLCRNSGVSFSSAIDLETGAPIDDPWFRSATEGIRSAIQSPDGRLLYGLSGTAVTIFDLNERRVIAEIPLQLDIPGANDPQSLALASDNALLFVGLAVPSEAFTAEIAVIDTHTWQELDRVIAEPPIATGTLAYGQERGSVFVARNDPPESSTAVERGTVLSLSSAGAPAVLATKPNEEILRLLSYSATSSTSDEVLTDRDAEQTARPLRVTTTSDGLGLVMSPVDPTTLVPLPGYAPISLGHHYTHAFSADGQTMAVISWPSGSHNRDGKLMLVNLADWTARDTGADIDQHTGDLLFSEDGQTLYWTLPTSIHPAHDMPRDFELQRFDLATGTRETVAAFPEAFTPGRSRLHRAGTRLAIWGADVSPSNLTEGPPQVKVVDLERDEIAATIDVPNVKYWQYQESGGGSVAYEIFYPGLAWDPERELLYVVHADEDRITVVDLRAGVVKLQRDITQPRALLERFADWLAPSASAKGNGSTSKLAVLSPDGNRLYVASNDESFTQTDDGEIVRTDATDLIIIDTERIEEIDRIDLGTIVWMKTAPDGRNLLVRSYDSVGYTTGHRLIKIDMDSGEIVGELKLPDLRASGPYVVGSEALLRVTDGAGDFYHTEELRVDLETFTIVSQKVLDDDGSHTYLEPD